MATPSTQPPRSRKPVVPVNRLKDSHSYGAVLGLIILLFVFADTAPTASWATATLIILQGLIFAVALWTSESEVERGGAVAAVVLAACLAFLELELGNGRVVSAAVSIASAAFTIATMVVIGRGVTRQREINSQSVSGAVSIYVLLGIFFVYVYAAVARLSSTPFFAQAGAAASRPLLLYFSFVTMTTVGYGDYSAAGQVGRTFAVIEALTGQLYLVTVVAILVSHFGRSRGRR